MKQHVEKYKLEHGLKADATVAANAADEAEAKLQICSFAFH